MPGKFEGEPQYVEVLWQECVMHGLVDDEFTVCDTLFSTIVIDDDLAGRFPELEGVYCLVLWESDQGFVYSVAFSTEVEYHEAIHEMYEEYERYEMEHEIDYN